MWAFGAISKLVQVVLIANGENPLAVIDSAATLTVGSNGNINLLDGKENSVWSIDVPVNSNTSFAKLFDMEAWFSKTACEDRRDIHRLSFGLLDRLLIGKVDHG
ncbi:hypothetical protein FEM48_Zijuj01G0139300 [Ziziphus jujuba var. spinosa]|uniref:Bulb-type lectin domain-containing protein n=1 Tax=Ziziphus jujuba var. spinosa TaxID=714518 RepID=A0A978W1N5_ZIZJJ|nr:hypothetical protein FEM48_Zijuj01G0139300 [Ziziphus jujuba var. spinosa]